MPPPKALLFDIGGVCVVSPFQAIADYESKHNIPKDWINFAISRSAPNGAWQRIERGEIPLDESFFAAFRADLHNQKLWDEYHRSFKHRRRRRSPTKEKSANEASDTENDYVPAMPWIESTPLFWNMMSISRSPDPHMFPALRYLRTQTPYLTGALSNTITFPPSHPFSRPPTDPSSDVRGQFDVFVASSDVGMRKPDRRIYELVVQRLDEFDRARGGTGIEAEQVVFLDDIGENCKVAKSVGMRTIKVNLGRTEEAVRELGSAIEVDLMSKIRGEKEKVQAKL